jgi:hypothetical protein
MISAIVGFVVFCAGASGLWYFMPRDGQPHPHTQVPVLDSVIPILIVGAFAVAVAMIVAGVASIVA